MPICKIVLDWLDSSTYFQNIMVKYILVETIEVTQRNPYWYEGCGLMESKNIKTTSTSATKFEDQESLAEYLSVMYHADKRIEIFEVARQLIPVLETKTTVSFK